MKSSEFSSVQREATPPISVFSFLIRQLPCISLSTLKSSFPIFQLLGKSQSKLVALSYISTSWGVSGCHLRYSHCMILNYSGVSLRAIQGHLSPYLNSWWSFFIRYNLKSPSLCLNFSESFLFNMSSPRPMSQLLGLSPRWSESLIRISLEPIQLVWVFLRAI